MGPAGRQAFRLFGVAVDHLDPSQAAEARARYRNAARGSPGETESPWWAGTKAGLYAFFVSGPRNLGVGAFNAGREAVYYVRDVAAVGADAVVTGTGALAGKNWSLGVEEWSQVGRNNQPSNPNFWSDALTNAGRAGFAGGTLGTTEIAIGTYQYVKTGDADAFQQQMGGVAAGNLAGAATIKAGQTLRTTARSNALSVNRALVNAADEVFQQGAWAERTVGAETVHGFRIYGNKGLVGSTYNRNIFLIEAEQVGATSPRTLLKAFEQEAAAAGAGKISIIGHAVVNPKLMNLNTQRMQRLGWTVEQINGQKIMLTKPLR